MKQKLFVPLVPKFEIILETEIGTEFHRLAEKKEFERILKSFQFHKKYCQPEIKVIVPKWN